MIFVGLCFQRKVIIWVQAGFYSCGFFLPAEHPHFFAGIEVGADLAESRCEIDSVRSRRETEAYFSRRRWSSRLESVWKICYNFFFLKFKLNWCFSIGNYIFNHTEVIIVRNTLKFVNKSRKKCLFTFYFSKVFTNFTVKFRYISNNFNIK